MPQLTIIISKKADEILRNYNRHKGDLSATVEKLILTYLKTSPMATIKKRKVRDAKTTKTVISTPVKKQISPDASKT